MPQRDVTLTKAGERLARTWSLDGGAERRLRALIADVEAEARAGLVELQGAAFDLLNNLFEAEVPGHGGEHVWYVVRLEDMDRLGALTPTTDPRIVTATPEEPR